MEQLLIEMASKHGPLGIMLAAVLFYYNKNQKQDMASTNSNTDAIRQLTIATTKLEGHVENINKSLGKVDRLEQDLNRAFIEIRSIKGEEGII